MWSSPACPDADALRRFAGQSLDAEQLQRVADHLRVCESCRHSLAQIDARPLRQQPQGDTARSTSASAGDRLAEITGNRTRSACAAHSRLDAETWQDPRLQYNPEHDDGDWQQEFHVVPPSPNIFANLLKPSASIKV
jgi:hypothetical protein